jgi:hypothetical protein
MDDERYAKQVPCSCCFESSGYMARWIPDTWSEPGWEDADPTRPCEHCHGTGCVVAEPITLRDLEDMAADATETVAE